ncbi:MAG: hypothetical protein WC374_10615 [Phycisphaerae bacterium]|jgi:hypothetical protein
MKHSIICNQSEVRGLLDGSKTEFYLPLNPQPLDVLPMNIPGAWVTLDTREPNHGSVITAPYKVGQIIKVRETWADFEGGVNLPFYPIMYKADDDTAKFKWRSAATMPLWASRLSLLVLDVQVSKFDLWKFVVKVEVMK